MDVPTVNRYSVLRDSGWPFHDRIRVTVDTYPGSFASISRSRTGWFNRSERYTPRTDDARHLMRTMLDGAAEVVGGSRDAGNTNRWLRFDETEFQAYRDNELVRDFVQPSARESRKLAGLHASTERLFDFARRHPDQFDGGPVPG